MKLGIAPTIIDLHLFFFRSDAQGASKEPLLYSNVPTTPAPNCYVKMTACDNYQVPTTSAYKIPYAADKDGTYV